ncbi:MULTISPECIES: holo-ACP synthase [unclassified Guyparkeria]|uniref:holo-ACP synthase n=1 Tax=unclassified Guyparkeria TaxID=2626246 RepID=UPI00073345D0|nr:MULTISPECIES: holo-ACP synthase [unclassified Guyparkeria]KTG15886.1 ACP synthase [Guyparkeria sp. XI15]OAE84636.1 ACP synthase [Guyparkeria sp. WRN-7]
MILGIGTDLVEIARIRGALERHGDRLIERVLGAEERQRLPEANPAAWLAKRFATKEAVAKALGTGFRDGLRLVDIQTRHDGNGRPEVVLLGRAREVFERMGAGEISLSVSDERSYALAFVVISR